MTAKSSARDILPESGGLWPQQLNTGILRRLTPQFAFVLSVVIPKVKLLVYSYIVEI